MGAWTWLRLPETLPIERRRTTMPAEIFSAVRKVLTTRQTLGYALASGMMFGANFGFIVSAQQVFTDIFGLGIYFPAAFAGVALGMALSSFINSRLVGRFGMRLISHGAVVLFTACSGLLIVLGRVGLLELWSFMLLIACIMFLLGMMISNFIALAMEPQGSIAGTASSLVGSIATVLAASFGHLIGQAYDGTVVPLSTGYFTLGLATLVIVLVTERGKLFPESPLQRPTAS
jgi:DHA1 family bicyclomycin/chloramphenicol resistance-like MFS transporter